MMNKKTAESFEVLYEAESDGAAMVVVFSDEGNPASVSSDYDGLKVTQIAECGEVLAVLH